MKTQLIPLETHDDLISVRDRISWAKTPRILLIWPKSKRIPLRSLELKVLQRHAASLGAQLGLVVRHRNIRREAQSLGIPVFNSTGEAQRIPWPERGVRRTRERRRPRQDLREKREQVRARGGAWYTRTLVRGGAFLLGVLAVLAIASLFIPHARVILQPVSKTQSVTLPVQADPTISTIFITGRIPSRELSIALEGNLQARATGRVPVPQTKAKGVVTFRNLTEEAVNITSGTVLTSTGLPGVRFLTTEDGELPGGLKETVDIPVEAESAGTTGNVDMETIRAIEGNLGLVATVTNTKPTTGGHDRMTEAATESDLARMREDLLKELMEQALAELKSMLATNDQIFPDTLQIEQILEESYEPQLGQPSNQVELSMRVEFTVSYAAGADLTELASTVLNASLPEGFVATSDPITFEILNSQSTDDEGVTHWTMRAYRKLEKQVNAVEIVPLVQGRSVAIAMEQLENNPDFLEHPEIYLTPKWWPWLPLIPFNIVVEIQ